MVVMEAGWMKDGVGVNGCSTKASHCYFPIEFQQS